MKKFFAVLGVVFLVFIVLVGAFVGYAAIRGSKLDASSKAYVDQTIPVIASGWSTDELTNDASPELKQTIGTQSAQLDKLFQKLSGLGALTHYNGSKGTSNIFFDTRKGKIITATYTANATFEHGDAQFSLKLIQHDGQWHYLGFYVNSPILLQ
jgi:hypothetical protein